MEVMTMKKWLVAMLAFLLCLLVVPALAETSGTCGAEGDGNNLVWVLDDAGTLTISGTGWMRDYSHTIDTVHYTDPTPWGRDVRQVIVEPGVANIGNGAFYSCSALTSVTLPEGVTSIGELAFCFCSSLISITLPESVTSIGHDAFYNCSSLTSISIPDGLTSIDDNVFSGCKNLMSITLPDSVTSIGMHAFWMCSKIAITLPDGVTSIGNQALSGTWIAHLGSDTARLISERGDSFVDPLYPGIYLKYTFLNNQLNGLTVTRADRGIENVVLPDGVTSIGDEVFKECSSLTSISIPEGLLSIGNYAFQNCISLMSITPPEGLSSIGNYAFQNCRSLTSITLRNGLTSIGSYAFADCSSLMSISIPEGVTSISYCAFPNCSSMTSITLPESVTNIGGSAFSGCSSLTSITLPEGLTSIGTSAFSGCSTLASITLPEGLTIIDYYTFSNCNGLVSITLPESVTAIGGAAFSNCSSLTSITLPESLTSIYERTFTGCSSLTSITLPKGVTSIDSSAFENCSSLTSIVVDRANSAYMSIDGILYNKDGTELIRCPAGKKGIVNIPVGVTGTGLAAFANCSSLTSITLPEGLTNIGNHTFQNCSSLTTVTLREGVTNIGEYAFYNCSSLISITLPEGVTSIGDSAFDNCSKLSKIVIPNSAQTFGNWVIPFNLPHVIVYCYKSSSADAWATGQNYDIVYLDNSDIESIRTVTLPEDFRLALEEPQELAVSVFPDYDHPTLTLTSSDPETVSVENGMVTAHKIGTATITASVNSVSDSVTITTYIPAASFAFELPEVWTVANQGVQLTLTDFEPENASAYLTWSSSNTSTASVDTSGYVTTYEVGEATITAASERGVSRTCVVHACYPVSDVELHSPLAELRIGQSVALIANVTMLDQHCANQLVTFSSTDESLASVNPRGEVLGVGAGSVTITATADNGVSASVTLEITSACETHVPEADPEVAPTCTKSGLTAGSHCAICGEVLETQTEIPALGHNWSITSYTWSEEDSVVITCHICSRDASHTYEETLNTLILPEALTRIEEEAFSDTNCQALVLSENCESIGSRAFANCRQLVCVLVSSEDVEIAEDAFEGCGDVSVVQR